MSSPQVDVTDEMIERGMDGAWSWTKAHADYAGNPDEDWRDCDEPEAVEDLRGIVRAVLTAALSTIGESQ